MLQLPASSFTSSRPLASLKQTRRIPLTLYPANGSKNTKTLIQTTADTLQERGHTIIAVTITLSLTTITQQRVSFATSQHLFIAKRIWAKHGDCPCADDPSAIPHTTTIRQILYSPEHGDKDNLTLLPPARRPCLLPSPHPEQKLHQT